MVTRIFDKQLKNNLELTGIPTAPTASPGTNTTQIATTAYVDAKVMNSITEDVTTVAPSQNAVFDALALKADITDTNALSLVVVDNQLRLSDHDNLLRGYNPTGAERVNIDSTARSVSLPLNTVEAGLNVLQGGMTLTNLVTNGNFSIDENSDGLADNWGMDGVTHTYGENGNLIATVFDPGTIYPGSRQRIGNIIANHKYYARAKIKVDSVCVNIILSLADGNTPRISFCYISSPNANQWYLMSGIASYTENFTGDLWLYHRYVDNATSIGKKLEADAETGVMLIDLTAHGLDSLTVSQVDALVAAGYFDSIKSATATRIKVVDADSGNPTHQYVEPIVLRRLPNGTRDTVEDNVFVQRIQKHILLSTEIIGIASGTYIQYVTIPISVFTDVVPQDTNIADGSFIVKGFPVELVGATSVDAAGNEKCFETSSTLLLLCVALGTYANLAAAQAALAGTEIYYALTTPIITNNVASGVPIAYPGGTITLEPVLADVGYYTDKFEISRTGYPIISLETLSIVDLATGQLTPLDISTAVIAGDGLSFTHADLTAGNLVDVTYVWGYSGVYGENTFSYLDSTVVKADTTDGKFYKAVPSFTNGVLSWVAEEVV